MAGVPCQSQWFVMALQCQLTGNHLSKGRALSEISADNFAAQVDSTMLILKQFDALVAAGIQQGQGDLTSIPSQFRTITAAIAASIAGSVPCPLH